MKRMFLAAAALAALVSCSKTPAYAPKEPEAKGPRMGTFVEMDTDVTELSSLCMNADGTALWTVSDDTKEAGGIYLLNFDGSSVRKSEFLHDIEGITISPDGILYIAVEGEQAIYKVEDLASEPKLVGIVRNDAADAKGKGIEAITWYKDDVVIVGNQQNPTQLSFFNVSTGETDKTITVDFPTFISDLCYDPVDNLLWMVDSKSKNIFVCTVEGELKYTFSIADMVGIYGKAEGITIDRKNGTVWVGCDVSKALYKVDFKF